MTTPVPFTLDGRALEAEAGQTILAAADAAGVWIPRLCHMPGLEPWGGCRVCTVLVNGRAAAACVQPVAPGIFVESDTEELRDLRRTVVEMMFVEGNHFCMFCEKSGNCELQALAYKLEITAHEFPPAWSHREVDASHPDIILDHNRCILCTRCVRTSRDLDGKHVFGFEGRGHRRRITVNAETRLADTNVDVRDRAIAVCPVGALLPKRQGYAIPLGERRFDRAPIGSDVEGAAEPTPEPAAAAEGREP